jgi:hypothetical protein
MTVLKFERRRAEVKEGWRSAELQQLIALSAKVVAAGEASGWEMGSTERGDPQAFLLGPSPDYDCILSVSRLGDTYVIEDGAGRVLYEQRNPAEFIEQAAAALRRRKKAFIASVAVAWCSLRQAFEERTEALAEEMELLSHFAPQLAALA